MVDVSGKAATPRRAIAESFVRLSQSTMRLIERTGLPKGSDSETGRLAGILAAKRTAELIPLCHPVPLTHVQVEVEPHPGGVRFRSTVSCTGPTGVEMEALTAVAVAALTLYDMVKAVEKEAVIEKIRLLEKTGGKSGTFRARK